MSFEENLKHADESLEKLNNQELALDESVKIYKEGLESIKKARLELEKAKLEVEQIDE
ncbi:exodeoxyribonuclease VII small subunit [Campylobacter jejuni]